jgi:hypothetical protein
MDARRASGYKFLMNLNNQFDPIWSFLIPDIKIIKERTRILARKCGKGSINPFMVPTIRTRVVKKI